MDNPLGETPKISKGLQSAGVASGLGCTVVFSLLGCILGGIFLDRWLGTEPVLTLIGIAVGLIAAGYTLYELVVLSDSRRGLVKLRGQQSPTSPGDTTARSNTGPGASGDSGSRTRRG